MRSGSHTHVQTNIHYNTIQEWSKLYYEASIAKVDREERVEQTAELIEKVDSFCNAKYTQNFFTNKAIFGLLNFVVYSTLSNY